MNNVYKNETEQAWASHLQKIQKKIGSAKITAWLMVILIVINTAGAMFVGHFLNRTEYETGEANVRYSMNSYEANTKNDRTVYQQIVSNGWVAKDLLETIGKQNAVLIQQNSESKWITNLLLFNLLITMGWLSVALIRIGVVQLDIRNVHLQLTSPAALVADKSCPYCAETIKAEARTCRYCRRDLIQENFAADSDSAEETRSEKQN